MVEWGILPKYFNCGLFLLSVSFLYAVKLYSQTWFMWTSLFPPLNLIWESFSHTKIIQGQKLMLRLQHLNCAHVEDSAWNRTGRKKQDRLCRKIAFLIFIPYHHHQYCSPQVSVAVKICPFWYYLKEGVMCLFHAFHPSM